MATTPTEIAQTLTLRHDVFVKELGATTEAATQETDRFDDMADHLILRDQNRARDDQIIGTYRLISHAQAQGQGYSSAEEFDLSPLLAQGERILELSRSCVHPDYRDGQAMVLLWQALAALIEQRGVTHLFGVASFHGTDAATLSEPLSLLHHRHLAPATLRPVSKKPAKFDLIPYDRLDRKAALSQIPALIKAYLRIGGVIGQGAYVDHGFNTTDVCMVLDLQAADARKAALYQGRR